MTRDNIFKFVSVRAPQVTGEQSLEKNYARYDKVGQSPLHAQIVALEEPDVRIKAIELATAYLNSDNYFVRSDALVSLIKFIISAVKETSKRSTVKKVRWGLKETFDIEVVDYINDPSIKNLKDSLWDGFYAQVLAPEILSQDRDLIYAGIRALHFLEVIVQEVDENASNPIPFHQLSKIRVTIPKDLVSFPDQEGDSLKASSPVRDDLKNLTKKLLNIQEACEDIKNNDRIFYSTHEPPIETSKSPSAPIDQKAFLKSLQDLPKVDSAVFKLIPTLHQFESRLESKPWVLAEFGQKNLKPGTKKMLTAYTKNIEEQDAPNVVETLEKAIVNEALAFFKRLSPEELSFIAETDDLKVILELVPIPFTKMPSVKTRLKTAADPTPGSAAARGIRPLGIGDLLVVKEELLRYEVGEVAHIENVLKSEFKNRKHRRLSQTEETTTLETEETDESEKDLQSTERFELQKETQKTIESDLSFKAGVKVSGSYGMVSFSASSDFATSTSQSESNRNATTFAKEVTERSVSRIKQRVRQERTRRTLEEFEETNEHGFDNRNGEGHVIGLYRWVDKYYLAKIVNYGKRLMFEFIVPEPAAFYRHAVEGKGIVGIDLDPPEKPIIMTSSGSRPLRPTDLNSSNYTEFVRKYNVQDVEVYPAASIRVGMAFGEGLGNENTPIGKAYKELQVPDGYKATSWSGSWGWVYKENNQYAAPDFRVGDSINNSNSVFNLEKIIPVSIEGSLQSFAINITVNCQRKQELLSKWQLETFSAIMTAYERLLADYNEQVAVAEIQQGVDIQGRNPDFNRKIEREELQKACLRLLTNEYMQTRVGGKWRYFEHFNAMQPPSGIFGYPEFDVDEAITEGKMIQFFEQAFEWDNITYLFYPYFWGRKDKWLDTFPLSDVDPKFQDFLRAGSARVAVPAHPAYAEVILHYLNTNEIWNGGEAPTLDDPLYISIVDEIKANTGADIDDDLPACSIDSGYPCVVDEWEIKLPTNLVYLQKKDDLPN